MIPGYNHNVQYKNRIYHIQTEDSGVQNPHIITLLYYGGNILSRKKTSYEDILKSEKLNQVVKEMMQEQHKSMLKDLKNGLMDERIAFMLDGVQPAAPAEAPAPAPQAPATPPPTAAAPKPPAPAAPRPAAPPQAARPAPPAARPAAPGAAVPPRPAAPQAPRPGAPLPPRPGASAAPPRPAPPRTAPPPTAQPRPAPPRPVAPPPPPPPPPTGKIIELSDDVELKDEDIFGADLISDKSLDEVILNYLAQNIEEE